MGEGREVGGVCGWVGFSGGFVVECWLGLWIEGLRDSALIEGGHVFRENRSCGLGIVRSEERLFCVAIVSLAWVRDD